MFGFSGLEPHVGDGASLGVKEMTRAFAHRVPLQIRLAIHIDGMVFSSTHALVDTQVHLVMGVVGRHLVLSLVGGGKGRWLQR